MFVVFSINRYSISPKIHIYDLFVVSKSRLKSPRLLQKHTFIIYTKTTSHFHGKCSGPTLGY